MVEFILNKFLQALLKRNIELTKSKILIMGASFKENCSDIRNSKAIELYLKLKELNIEVEIFDNIVNENDVRQLHQIKLLNTPKNAYYDGIIIAVPHRHFVNIGINKIQKFGKDN